MSKSWSVDEDAPLRQIYVNLENRFWDRIYLKKIE